MKKIINVFIFVVLLSLSLCTVRCYGLDPPEGIDLAEAGEEEIESARPGKKVSVVDASESYDCMMKICGDLDSPEEIESAEPGKEVSIACASESPCDHLMKIYEYRKGLEDTPKPHIDTVSHNIVHQESDDDYDDDYDILFDEELDKIIQKILDRFEYRG